MTENTWDKERLQQFIDDEIEESLTIEYKEGRALLDKTEKKEITRDVSAFANSNGGTIIYGIAEFQDDEKKHLPEKITPIDRTQFSKERLEQIINNIQPRIDGVVIHSIQLNPVGSNNVAYVVDIPKGDTAHQAMDKRYYKRYNFQRLMMEDYEIRDVMNRNQHPKIEIEFEIEITSKRVQKYLTMLPGESKEPEYEISCELHIWVENRGNILAKYVNAIIEIPTIILKSDSPYEHFESYEKYAIAYTQYYADNTVRDIVDSEYNVVTTIYKYGPSRYEPILPKRNQRIKTVEIYSFQISENPNLTIDWKCYADNAQPTQGKIAIKDIKVIDKTS